MISKSAVHKVFARGDFLKIMANHGVAGNFVASLPFVKMSINCYQHQHNEPSFRFFVSVKKNGNKMFLNSNLTSLPDVKNAIDVEEDHKPGTNNLILFITH